jgi:hypothetical protein
MMIIFIIVDIVVMCSSTVVAHCIWAQKSRLKSRLYTIQGAYLFLGSVFALSISA